jgi:hypothetical protein
MQRKAFHLFPLLDDEQIAEFKAMYADLSLTLPEIAATFGVSVSTLKTWRRRLDLPVRPVNVHCHHQILDDDEPADFYDSLPPETLPARPARARPSDRPGERWLQLI